MDPETGLIYLQNRYYEPTIAQYLTRDPLDALTGSAYGYVNDNPLNGSDPTGLFCLIHNSKGGCLGAGVLKKAQKPIAIYSTVEAGISAAAQNVSTACDLLGAEACAEFGSAIAEETNIASTVANVETTTYECTTAGLKSTACASNFAVLGFSVINSLTSLNVANPVAPVAFSDLNFYVNVFSLRRRLAAVKTSCVTNDRETS